MSGPTKKELQDKINRLIAENVELSKALDSEKAYHEAYKEKFVHENNLSEVVINYIERQFKYCPAAHDVSPTLDSIKKALTLIEASSRQLLTVRDTIVPEDIEPAARTALAVDRVQMLVHCVTMMNTLISPAKSARVSRNYKLSTEVVAEILECLPDQKINAIKACRHYTGLGLKEAKDLIETVLLAANLEEALFYNL